jgi:hypothetical protein
LGDWIDAVARGDLRLRRGRGGPDAEALAFPDERLTFAEVADRARTWRAG